MPKYSPEGLLRYAQASGDWQHSNVDGLVKSQKPTNRVTLKQQVTKLETSFSRLFTRAGKYARYTMRKRASVWGQFCDLWKQPQSSGVVTEYPRMRNAILDIMAEGRRKNIINLLLRVDITALWEELERLRKVGAERPSLTACVAQAFAAAIDADRSLQAYRLGRKKMVLFDEVDLAMMVEREIDGQRLPVVHIIRQANHKDVGEIDRSLRHAKTAPLGSHGPLSRLEYRFFTLPRFLRRLVWRYLRYDPYAFKQLAGTVGITSMGMHMAGSAVVLPITPMSLTLSIGSVELDRQIVDGRPVLRRLLQLNIGADHDVIDGAPLMRFGERFRIALERGTPLVDKCPEL